MRRANFFIAILTILILGYGLSCTHKADLNNIPPVSFSKNVLPIFISNCNLSGCHGSDGRARKLTDYSSVLKLVTPGNANGSSLYQSIIGSQGSSRMPPAGNWLSEQQTQLVFLWIMQGAQNN